MSTLHPSENTTGNFDEKTHAKIQAAVGDAIKAAKVSAVTNRKTDDALHVVIGNTVMNAATMAAFYRELPVAKKKLREDIHETAREQFQRHFGFSCDDDHPNKKAGTRGKTVQALLEFVNLPSEEELRLRVDHELWPRNSTIFAHNGPEIYDNILINLKRCTDSTTSKEENVWHSLFDTPQLSFSAQDGSKRTVQENSVFVYGFSHFVANKIAVKKFYIKWLGVFFQI